VRSQEEKLAARLKHIRAGRTLPEMAEVLDVSSRTVSNYESGLRAPDAWALACLVTEGWNANWILSGEGPERLSKLSVAALSAL